LTPLGAYGHMANEKEDPERQAILDCLDKADAVTWVALMRNMVQTLAEYDEALLAQLLCREAERRAEKQSGRPADFLAKVMDECGVGFRDENAL
jgi:hypothetical protein